MLNYSEIPHEQTDVVLSKRKDDAARVQQDEEQKVWTGFIQGDERALTVLYRENVVRLYHYGERFSRDRALIEDSIHDFFVELWKSRAALGQISSVRSYLYKGFKNRLIKNIQKTKKFPYDPLATNESFDMVFSFESHLIAEQTTADQKQRLLNSMNCLSPRQKEALTLRFFDELSYEEISSIMAVPVKSVYMLVYRAVAWLRKDMTPASTILFLAALEMM